MKSHKPKKPAKNKSKDSSLGTEWTIDLLHNFDKHLSEIAKEYKLDIYPNQIEIISAEQMMDAYSSVGMPLSYNHWSYGKQLLIVEKSYKRGLMGLAYELVINSDPCIAYLMEENTLTLQVMTIAHACYGHNSFFKGNYLFRTWTNADSIIDYLVFAKNYISECEEKYGVEAVEDLLDALHAIKNYGVDRYRKPPKLSLAEEKARQKNREEYLQSQVNDLWRTLPKSSAKSGISEAEIFPKDPEENILYFIEKNAPLLEPWQREVTRIVRKISQYFYPQSQTKVMNEGWATFWHYTLVNDLYKRGLVDDAFMVEFIHNHTDVIQQLPFDHPRYYGINPYALGFAMFQDIRRICENPTKEDKEWFPDLVGKNWIETLNFAMTNYKDESFIAQYLSPKVIRDLKLFSILNDPSKNEFEVTDIHDESGYKKIRALLSQNYNISITEPNIQIYKVDRRGDRSMTLRHITQNGRNLDKYDQDLVLMQLYKLWGFKIILETIDEQDHLIRTETYPAEKS